MDSFRCSGTYCHVTNLLTLAGLWDTGIHDDKFAVIAKMNETCNIAVETPVGVTERLKMGKIEMKGTKFSNIKCSIQRKKQSWKRML